MDILEAPLRSTQLYDAIGRAPGAGMSIWRLDGAGIALQAAGSLCYIDPFLADEGAPGWVRSQPRIIDLLPPPSLVLLTHEHDDHADPVALRQLSRTSCLLAGPAPAVEVARGAGFLNRQTIVLTAGMSFQLGVASVTAVRVKDDDSIGPLGYLVQMGGFSLYHGGDAQMSSAFDETGAAYSTTVACLSAAGKVDNRQFYLTPEQALAAARALRAQTLIPIHWDLWTINGLPRSAWDPVVRMAEQDATAPEVAMLAPGQRYVVL